VKAWRWSGAGFEPAEGVPLTDRGFRYGMSLFESVRVAAGEAEFWDKHVARLVQACGERDFALDEAALPAAAETFRQTGNDGFGRIYVTAGDGALTAQADAPRIFLFLEDRKVSSEEESYDVTISEETYHAPFRGLKTANYWLNAEVLTQARRRGFDEALLFNEFAELVSACCANIFIVRDERIATPPRSSGARAGVIREWVIGRRKVEERRMRREDVVNADEIFLTNSWLGVMPVSTVEGRPLGHRLIGPRLAAELENRRKG
jgi:branched-subunit amino acid aminotransferase/4-amino-4-deoxychorismate lyase